MSDFDKFFADRLNEEGQFPHREKNWQTLSKRLDVFGAGTFGLAKRLKYWQAAAAVTFLAASVLLAQTILAHRENAELRRQLMETAQEKQALLQTMRGAVATIPVPTPGGISTQPNRNLALSPAVEKLEYAAAGDERTGRPVRHENTRATAQTRFFDQQNPSLANMPSPTPVLAAQETGITPTATSGTAVANLQEITPEQALRPQRLALSPLPPKLYTGGKLVSALPVTGVQAAEQGALIKPLRHYASRFRVGVNATSGVSMPHQQGISASVGSGLSASYTVWRHIRVQATADWLRYKVSATKYLAQFHFPPSPDPSPIHPPSPDDELVLVEAGQHFQLFTAGVSYSIPIRSRLRPTLHLAHSWMRVAPTLYSFKFEEKPHGPGPGKSKFEYWAVQSEQKWVSNVWQAGLGLEYETPRWVFGLNADYSKHLAASEPMSDALFLRAGVQYKFD